MATATEELVKGTSSILGWYDSSRPMWIDLVGDYAGRELFLVEGDSLLRECFEDERIDFDGKFNPAFCPTFPFGIDWNLFQDRWYHQLQVLPLLYKSFLAR
jgi:hypothetical protein